MYCSQPYRFNDAAGVQFINHIDAAELIAIAVETSPKNYIRAAITGNPSQFLKENKEIDEG